MNRSFSEFYSCPLGLLIVYKISLFPGIKTKRKTICYTLEPKNYTPVNRNCYFCAMQNTINQYKHATPIDIRFSDCDILGHVNNAIYQQYFDFARMRYFQKVLEEEINWHENAVMVATITIDYLSPIPLDDDITLYTRIDALGNKSMGMTQLIYSQKDRKLRATNKAVLVCYNRKQNATVSIPESWRRRFLGYDRNITVKVPFGSPDTKTTVEEKETVRKDPSIRRAT